MCIDIVNTLRYLEPGDRIHFVIPKRSLDDCIGLLNKVARLVMVEDLKDGRVYIVVEKGRNDTLK